MIYPWSKHHFQIFFPLVLLSLLKWTSYKVNRVVIFFHPKWSIEWRKRERKSSKQFSRWFRWFFFASSFPSCFIDAQIFDVRNQATLEERFGDEEHFESAYSWLNKKQMEEKDELMKITRKQHTDIEIFRTLLDEAVLMFLIIQKRAALALNNLLRLPEFIRRDKFNVCGKVDKGNSMKLQNCL